MFEIKDEDLLLMTPELYNSVASCFVIKVITKYMTLFYFLYLFWDISSFKSEKGDTAKLSLTGFIYKKKINTCTAKVQEIHS